MQHLSLITCAAVWLLAGCSAETAKPDVQKEVAAAPEAPAEDRQLTLTYFVIET